MSVTYESIRKAHKITPLFQKGFDTKRNQRGNVKKLDGVVKSTI